jgi:deoxyribose-phosphate aldolase
MADQLDALVDQIVVKVKQRLALRSPCDGTSCSGCEGCATRRPGAVQALVAAGAKHVSSAPGVEPPSSDLADMIDHTLLKPEATRDELKKMCDEAIKYGFRTVCVNSANIPYCAERLRGHKTVPIAVVGFPLGAMTPKAKAFEAREAVRAGAAEIDMVINLGALKSHDYAMVLDDISEVVRASAPRPVKVIIETGMLTDEEKVVASALAKMGGAAFVKTSTGFAKGGATVDDVALIRRVVGNDMEIKASGGVRTKEDALAMIAAGATRIGASASVNIVLGAKTDKKGY